MSAVEVPLRFESERMLWWVDEVYTPEECRQFIQRIECARPELATNNPLYRDQDRAIVDDPQLASDLFRRLRPSLPAEMGDLKLAGLNDRLRMYRYQPGQKFAPHMDHWYRPDDAHVSLHTVLVYFNDNFTGGETRFTEQLDATVVPKPGRVAIFQHKLRHEGCEVTSGVKYAMRSDVIYLYSAR
jgi:hypothetical protein